MKKLFFIFLVFANAAPSFAACTADLDDLIEDYEFVYRKLVDANYAHNSVVDRESRYSSDFEAISMKANRAAVAATGKTTGEWSTLVDEKSRYIYRYLRKNKGCTSSEFNSKFSRYAPTAKQKGLDATYFFNK